MKKHTAVKSLALALGSAAQLKTIGVGLAGMALALILVLPSEATDPKAQTSTVVDPAGDAVFSTDLFGGPVPPYLDMVKASVSYSRGSGHSTNDSDQD